MKTLSLMMVVLMALFSSAILAADLSSENLLGEWEFVNWAEAETPQETHAVGVVMDFKADGRVLTEMPKGVLAESYKIDGDTIVYKGTHGDQLWKLVSLTPKQSLIVNNSGTIMTFQRK